MQGLSAANGQFMAILQSYPDFGSGAGPHPHGWRRNALMHGDMKFDNVVVLRRRDDRCTSSTGSWPTSATPRGTSRRSCRPISRGGSRRCSASRRGEGAERRGAVSAGVDSARHARVLGRVRSLARLSARDADAELERAVGYAGARMLQTVYESMAWAPALTPARGLAGAGVHQHPQAAARRGHRPPRIPGRSPCLKRIEAHDDLAAISLRARRDPLADGVRARRPYAHASRRSARGSRRCGARSRPGSRRSSSICRRASTTKPTAAPLGTRTDPPANAASIIDALSAANAGRDRWESGWALAQVDAERQRHGAQGRRWRNVSRRASSRAAARRTRPSPGAPLHVLFTRESRTQQPGFYIVNGETPRAVRRRTAG